MNDILAAYLPPFALLIGRPAIVLAILSGLWIALGRARLDASARVVTWLAVALPTGAWFAAVWTLAADGVFVPQPGGVSLLPVAVVAPVLIGLFALTRSQRIAAAVDAATPSWLVGIQVYRILGGNFIVLWSLGAAPGVFALPAGLGDVLVGLLALPVAFYLATNARGGRTAAIAWNLLGITDLINAVTLGILSSPGPQQLLALGHANAVVASYPTVMTPAFSVPLSLILHGVSLWQLRRRARRLTLRPAVAA